MPMFIHVDQSNDGICVSFTAHATLPERAVHAAESLMQDGLSETRMHAKQSLAQLQRLMEQHGPPGSFTNSIARLSNAASSPRDIVR